MKGGKEGHYMPGVIVHTSVRTIHASVFKAGLHDETPSLQQGDAVA